MSKYPDLDSFLEHGNELTKVLNALLEGPEFDLEHPAEILDNELKDAIRRRREQLEHYVGKKLLVTPKGRSEGDTIVVKDVKVEESKFNIAGSQSSRYFRDLAGISSGNQNASSIGSNEYICTFICDLEIPGGIKYKHKPLTKDENGNTVGGGYDAEIPQPEKNVEYVIWTGTKIKVLN